MYSTKIMGTKYETVVEQDGGMWYVRIKLNGNVEAEEPLPQMTANFLEKKLKNILGETRIVLNDLQFKMLMDNLMNQFPHLLEKETKDDDSSPEQLKKIEQLENTIKSLQETIDTLVSRIERLEQLLG
ncbi:MAG: hypothetical protein D6732_21560 [Methanobacteriota archaeon]|nr:MAG: hypothetical protein D6732_21560 [Euryarchaeota archaeon]